MALGLGNFGEGETFLFEQWIV